MGQEFKVSYKNEIEDIDRLNKIFSLLNSWNSDQMNISFIQTKLNEMQFGIKFKDNSTHSWEWDASLFLTENEGGWLIYHIASNTQIEFLNSELMRMFDEQSLMIKIEESDE